MSRVESRVSRASTQPARDLWGTVSICGSEGCHSCSPNATVTPRSGFGSSHPLLSNDLAIIVGEVDNEGLLIAAWAMKPVREAKAKGNAVSPLSDASQYLFFYAMDGVGGYLRPFKD